MSEAVFLACLKCRGFHGRRLQDEFRYQDQVKNEISMSKAANLCNKKLASFRNEFVTL